jgi:hypothetical protein
VKEAPLTAVARHRNKKAGMLEADGGIVGTEHLDADPQG